MSKTRPMLTLGTLCVAVLAAGAVPAFTADSGTITVTVCAAAPASPCVEFATPPGANVNFGTLAFSTSAQTSGAEGDVAPRFSNCSTAAASLLVAGTNATGSGATWTLAGGVGNPCAIGLPDRYRLFYNTDGNGSSPIATTNAPLQNLATGETTFAPGEAHDLGLELAMPCQGSAGAGEDFSLSVTLTAQVT